MTERNLPHEDQKEYGIWTKYFLKRFEDAGIEVGVDCTGIVFPEDIPEDSNARLLYWVNSPNYMIESMVQMMPKRMPESETLADLVDESVRLAVTANDFWIHFNIKDGVAKAHVENWGDHAESELDFVHGQEYHPRQIIDALFTIFLQDYSNQRPGA